MTLWWFKLAQCTIFFQLICFQFVQKKICWLVRLHCFCWDQLLKIKEMKWFHQIHSQLLVCLQFFCYDRKSRAACVQSFAPWQQATIEIMLAISLTIACSRYTYDGVILHAHPVRGESYNQHNTTGEVATLSNKLCWWNSQVICYEQCSIALIVKTHKETVACRGGENRVTAPGIQRVKYQKLKCC